MEKKTLFLFIVFIQEMKYSLIISAVILGISMATASCKKSEEVKIERVEDVQAGRSDRGHEESIYNDDEVGKGGGKQ